MKKDEADILFIQEKAKEGNISFSFDKTKSTLLGYIENI